MTQISRRPERNRWKLSGLDAAFLHGETSRLPRHTLKLVEFDGVPSPSQVRAAAAWIEHHLPLAAATLHRRGLALRPELRGAGPLDLEYHFDRHEVPASTAGLTAAIMKYASALASSRLRRDRPLWRITLLDSKGGGRCCAILQIHHALVDGSSFAAIFHALTHHAGEPETAGSPATGRPLAAASRRPLPVWFDEIMRWVRGPFELLMAVACSVRDGVARWRSTGSSQPFSGPVTRLNGPLSRHRLLVPAELSLDDVKRVKQQAGVSVNDVLLGVVAHAVRRLGLTGDRPLIVAMPLGEPDVNARGWGNHLSNGFVSLHDNVDHPLERLQRIHESTEAAKRVRLRTGGATVSLWAGLLTPTYVRFYRRMIRWLGYGAPVNLVVSYVRGPRTAAKLGPFAITRLVSYGPLVECVGLNVTIWSYSDTLSVGLHADAAQLPNVADMAPALRCGLAILVAAVDDGKD